eukprot:scaffold47705_cov28-Tisochrysis_lutea.AAC.5
MPGTSEYQAKKIAAYGLHRIGGGAAAYAYGHVMAAEMLDVHFCNCRSLPKHQDRLACKELLNTNAPAPIVLGFEYKRPIICSRNYVKLRHLPLLTGASRRSSPEGL